MTLFCGHCGRSVTSAAAVRTGFGAECRKVADSGIPLLIFDDNSWMVELAMNGRRYYALAGGAHDWISDPRALAAELRADAALSGALASGDVDGAFARAEQLASAFAREELMSA